MIPPASRTLCHSSEKWRLGGHWRGEPFCAIVTYRRDIVIGENESAKGSDVTLSGGRLSDGPAKNAGGIETGGAEIREGTPESPLKGLGQHGLQIR